MSKDVEVIFTEDRKGQFLIGQKKKVKPGYARNYLFPFNLAVPFSPENEKKIASIEKKAEQRLSEKHEEASKLSKILQGKTITFTKKTHDDGLLYGSVTAQDTAAECNKQFETSLDKFDLQMPQLIKEIGSYQAKIAIHPDVDIELTVLVVSENEAAENPKKVQKKTKSESEDTESNNEEETIQSKKSKEESKVDE
jgi:large subunit ribosomal protein L9